MDSFIEGLAPSNLIRFVVGIWRKYFPRVVKAYKELTSNINQQQQQQSSSKPRPTAPVGSGRVRSSSRIYFLQGGEAVQNYAVKKGKESELELELEQPKAFYLVA
jgi:hypothetical protein